MERENVDSSNINSIWYSKSNLILEIEFSNNSIYNYLNVPESEYNGIMSADSKWKYLHQNIKSVYTCKQIS